MLAWSRSKPIGITLRHKHQFENPPKVIVTKGTVSRSEWYAVIELIIRLVISIENMILVHFSLSLIFVGNRHESWQNIAKSCVDSERFFA